LNAFYNSISYKKMKDGSWSTKFNPDAFRGIKLTFDLIDAKSGKKLLEEGKKITPRQARKFAEDGLKEYVIPEEALAGKLIAQDVVNVDTGEIYAEAGDELTASSIRMLEEKGFKELPVLDIDFVNTGPYIRNTLLADKNQTQEESLIDIYRVM